MSLSVTWREHHGAAVVRPVGEMDISTAHRLAAAMAQVLDAGHRDVVIDFDGLDFLDSSGVGALVSAWKAARAVTASLQFACDKPHFLRVFAVTGLATIFTIHPTLTSCLAAVGTAAEQSLTLAGP